MKDLFTMNEEMVCYRNKDELRESITYYLMHPEECQSTAQRAYQRVLREQRYFHRLTNMMRAIGTL